MRSSDVSIVKVTIIEILEVKDIRNTFYEGMQPSRNRTIQSTVNSQFF
jgi:hypothetical protein